MTSRRRPDYVRFVATGAVLGLLVGLTLAARTGGTEQYEATQVALYLGVFMTLLGALAGGVVAVLFDGRRPGATRVRRSRRSAP